MQGLTIDSVCDEGPSLAPSGRVAAITTAILGTIGLLAGYFPARTASGLKPVEALRM